MGLTGNRLGTDATGLSARALARDGKGGTRAQYETIVESLGEGRIEDRGKNEGVGHSASLPLRPAFLAGALSRGSLTGLAGVTTQVPDFAAKTASRSRADATRIAALSIDC